MRSEHSKVVFLFWGMIAILAGGSLLAQDAEFSENENRILAKRPSPSFAGIREGSFQEELESYLQDHLILRDEWNALHSMVLLAAGDTDIGGAYVGEDGFDFEKITEAEVDDRRIEANTRALKEFLERQEEALGRGRAAFILVPTSGLVLAEKVPEGAPLFDQEAIMDRICGALSELNIINIQSIFAQEEEPGELYYHTDHHWKTHGAYLAYRAWNPAAPPEEDYRITKVTERFRGSLYSRVLNANSLWDSIERYDLPREGEIPGLYDEAKLAEKDKYAYFMGGNQALVTIDNPGKEDGHLLVIKDSFANAFVPFAARDFARTSLIDLRYFTEDVEEYIAGQQVTDVLVLYNISNFISDRNVGRLGSSLLDRKVQKE